MFNYNIKIANAQISSNRGFLRAVTNQLRQIFSSCQEPLRRQIISIVYQALDSCPEVQSLRSGTLKYDFGIDNDITSLLVSNIAEAIDVEYKPIQFSFKGFSTALTVYIPQDRINFIVNSHWWATVKTEKGEILPWLNWMLTAGDSVVIAGYSAVYGNWGRSGGALMFKFNNFQVNPAYSGTPTDNFITRALDKKQAEIERVLRDFRYG